ncbi:MAG: WD40 repeat domain-containing protein [Planctomycetaceae bacterium]
MAVATVSGNSECHTCGISQITVWNSRTGRETWTRNLADEAVAGVHFHPDSGHLIVAGTIGSTADLGVPTPDAGVAGGTATSERVSVSIRDAATGELINRFGEGHTRLVASAAATNAPILATLDSTQTLAIWDIENQKLLQSRKLSIDQSVLGRWLSIGRSVLFVSPDGLLVACVNQQEKHLLLDAQDLTHAINLPLKTFVEFSADGKYLLPVQDTIPNSRMSQTSGWAVEQLRVFLDGTKTLPDGVLPPAQVLPWTQQLASDDRSIAALGFPDLKPRIARILTQPQASGFHFRTSGWNPDLSTLTLFDKNANSPILLWNLKKTANSRTRFQLPVGPVIRSIASPAAMPAPAAVSMGPQEPLDMPAPPASVPAPPASVPAPPAPPAEAVAAPPAPANGSPTGATDSFDWALHNRLRHEYATGGEAKKSLEQCDIILANVVMDAYTLNCLGAEESDPKAAVEELLRHADMFAEFRFVQAACLIRAAELKENSEEASKLLKQVATFDDEKLAKYRELAKRKLAKGQQGQDSSSQ